MDIMLAILSHSPPKTATSIMETCRFLYHEGAKVILQKDVFIDGRGEAVPPMVRFIQAEDLSRCSYVRNLWIFFVTLPEAVARALAVIVPRMCNLVNLSLCIVWQRLFDVYPYLLPAFASLRSVKNLMVRVGSYDLFRLIQSELVTANILSMTNNQPGTGQLPSSVSCHPVYLLQRSASTLQELICSDIKTVGRPPRIIYPNVHKFALQGNEVPFLPPYITAFPNLVHLSMTGHCPLIGGLPRPPLSQNQTQTTTTPHGLTKDPLVWKHIQTYTGTLSNLHAVGITFPIPRLYLEALPGAPYIPALTEVLAHVQPVHLTITYEDQPFSHVPASPDLLAALRSDGASRLQSLALRIDLMAADVDSNFDVGQFWTDLEAALKRLKLSALCISMGDISLSETVTASTAALRLPSTADGMQQSTHIHVHTRAHTDRTASRSSSSSMYDAPVPVTVDGPDADPSTRMTCPPDCSQCAEARRASLTLAERTLEDFDVGAFVDRLEAAVPTFQRAVVSVVGPSRWPGGPGPTGRARTAHLGKHDGLPSEMRVRVHDDFFVDREAWVREFMKPVRPFAAMARAWYHGQAARG
ncbi:hypothetical protein GSI_07701 [Ganoderma sinense ZZ0214-1]|nr:hypothetical protein GSI_07701 [Ganoderma sinense ZZ0214-1]